MRSPLPVIASGLSTGVTQFEPGKDGLPGTLLYSFRQDVPIQSYLFAIASGYVIRKRVFKSKLLIPHSDIATASIGPRSTVATGPEELQDAKRELEEDAERFIQTAEVRLSDCTNTSCCPEYGFREFCRLFLTLGRPTMF